MSQGGPCRNLYGGSRPISSITRWHASEMGIIRPRTLLSIPSGLACPPLHQGARTVPAPAREGTAGGHRGRGGGAARAGPRPRRACVGRDGL